MKAEEFVPWAIICFIAGIGVGILGMGLTDKAYYETSATKNGFIIINNDLYHLQKVSFP